LLFILVFGLLIVFGFQNCALIQPKDSPATSSDLTKAKKDHSDQLAWKILSLKHSRETTPLPLAPQAMAQIIKRTDAFNRSSLSTKGKLKIAASADTFDMYKLKVHIFKDSKNNVAFFLDLRSDELISKLVLEKDIRMSAMEVKLKSLQEALDKSQAPLLLQWQQEAELQTLRFGGFQSGAFIQGLSLLLKFKPLDQQHYAVSLLDDQGNSFFTDLKFKIY
jgi:hypothetical protein